MLKSRVSQEYARWWQFWFSKLPQRDTGFQLTVTATVLKTHSLSISTDRLRWLRNHAKAAGPLQCPVPAKSLCIDEES
jgi:hypothetical protein